MKKTFAALMMTGLRDLVILGAAKELIAYSNSAAGAGVTTRPSSTVNLTSLLKG